MKKIVLKFPDGNKRQFNSGITAFEVAQTISTSLSKKAISADVDGNHWDLQWAIERDCEISINTIKDENRAIELIRHDLHTLWLEQFKKFGQMSKLPLVP